jgi:hypothetical protein
LKLSSWGEERRRGAGGDRERVTRCEGQEESKRVRACEEQGARGCCCGRSQLPSLAPGADPTCSHTCPRGTVTVRPRPSLVLLGT